jgi:hypothetical protein
MPECWIVQSVFRCSDRLEEKDKRWSIYVLYHNCVPGIYWLPRDRHTSVSCLGITSSLSVHVLPFAGIWNVDDFSIPRQAIATMLAVKKTNKRIWDKNKATLNPILCHWTIGTMGPITGAKTSRSLWPVLSQKKERIVTSICLLSLPLDLWNRRN